MKYEQNVFFCEFSETYRPVDACLVDYFTPHPVRWQNMYERTYVKVEKIFTCPM